MLLDHLPPSSRDRLSFSKSILRRFIRDCVDRDAAVASPWTVKPLIAKHYGVSSIMPEETRKGVEDIKRGEIDKRKKVWEDREGPPTKKQKKMTTVGVLTFFYSYGFLQTHRPW
jgi:bromodomain adjacent to zinc finger domain protein 1A